MVDVSGTPEQTAAFSSEDDSGNPRAHVATNKKLVSFTDGSTSGDFYNLVADWNDVAKENGVWSNWQVCSLNMVR